MKIVIPSIILLFFLNSLSAQDKPFEDKANYISDLKKVLSATKNYNLIAFGTKFEANYWNSGNIDDIQKNKITEATKAFIDKSYPVNPYIISFLTCVSKAVDNKEVGQEELANFYSTLLKTTELQESPVLNNYIKVSTLFFEKRKLSNSPNNSVSLKGGTWNFKYLTAFPIPVNDTPTPDASGAILIDGPALVFEGSDLQLGSRFDTLHIKGTGGIFAFSDQVFSGKGGKIDWSALGDELKEVYVAIPAYRFNVNSNDIIVENVSFNYPSKLPNPIQGSFEYKTPASRNIKDSEYPKFTCQSTNVTLNSLGKNVVYQGAFSLFGKKFSSICLEDKPSLLTYNDGRKKFQTLSKNYHFKDSVITAMESEIIIFLGNDSITHPSGTFTFKEKSQQVSFQRDKGQYKSTHFRNTFHGFEMALDIISWNLNTDIIYLDIYAAKRQIPAIFKSTHYFNKKEFNSLQSISNQHPLRILDNYVKQTKAEQIYQDEVVKKYKLNSNTFNGALSDLRARGFIDYNSISGKITLKPKANHFLQSYTGKVDYDNLYIPSLSPTEPNASIDIKEYSMTIKGVKKFYISDSANVFALPDSQTVKVYQNKDILYNGVLVAGIYHFKGKKFQFNYNDFLVTLPQIDTIKFMKKKDTLTEGKRQYMDNHLVFSSGTLYINDPANKSAKKNYPEFPRFDATTGAYVYFTNREILGGVYDRQIYFKIPPFKTDSVKNSRQKNLKFKGQFHSGGLFPVFDEELKVMGDNSLGFKHKVPAEGFDLYNGKGKFYGTLKLDNGGIRGEGEIHYQSAVFYSNDFVFYQDSVIGQGPQAKVKEKMDSVAYFADADIADYELKWMPKQDSLHAINLKRPFEIYNKSVHLEGTLHLTPKGLGGSGLLEIKKEKVIAPKIEFNQKNVVARHAVLNSKLPGYEKNSIRVNNVKITFDLKESFADINPEIKGIAGIEFPLCEYATSIENARWDLTKRIVYMSAEDPNDISKSFFNSTNPEYDSLVFNASAAIYEINKKQLKIDGVPFIKVSDSKIIPDSGKVTVYENGRLKTFKRAKLIIDTLNGYHYLVKGKIDIQSRFKFDGTAVYNYVNLKGDTFLIPFEHFTTEEQILNKRETLRFTVTSGQVKETDKFYIAPKVLYRGFVKLVAHKQSLEFNGFVKIDIKKSDLKTEWLPYKYDGGLKDFKLVLNAPVAKKPKTDQQPISEAGSEDTLIAAVPTTLFNGIYYESGTYDIYSALVSNKKNETDEELFYTTGELRYDAQSSSFLIGDPKRLNRQTLVGNKYVYNDSIQTITCEGDLKLIKGDQNFKMQVSGQAVENLNKHRYHIKSLVFLKLNMPAKALEIISKSLSDVNTDEMLATNTDTVSKSDIELNILKLAQIGGEKAGRAYEKNYNELLDYKPLFKYSSKLAEGITFSNIHFIWSDEHKAWYSTGKLKLSNILNKDINREIEGLMEIKRTEQGDYVSLFIKSNPDTWFYINYQPGRLGLLSTDTDFNAAVGAKSKGETGTPTVYTFVVADESEHALFVKDFYKNYLGKAYDEVEEFRSTESRKEEQIKKEEQPEVILEETAPKKIKSKKKKKKEDIMTDDAPVENASETPVDSQPEPAIEEKLPSKKKKKKNDITTDDAPIEEVQESTEEQPENVKPVKLKKKKNKNTDQNTEDEPK